MFFCSSPEEKIHSNGKKIKELGIQLDLLSSEIENFYETQKIDAHEVEAYFSSSENFSDKEWEALQTIQQAHAQKLEAIHSNTADPRQTQKKYAERADAHHWIFMK